MERPVKLTVLLVLLGFSLFLNANLFVPGVRAWIPLEGHITQDTTLAVTIEPYRIVKDVIVDSGVTLTIEPGVTVEFADGLSLIVTGTLYAVGTDADSIVFTSSRTANVPPNPYPGAWNTVKFAGSTSESFTIKYSVITYAKNGITIESQGKAIIEKCEIRSNSESGIRIVGESNLEVIGNLIEANEYGVRGNGNPLTGLLFANNSIYSNNKDGISLTGGDIYNVEFLTNNASSNIGSGIYLYGSVVVNLTLIGNQVEFNRKGSSAYSGDGATVLATHRLSHLTILRNTAFSNEKSGAAFSIPYSRGIIHEASIHDVTISENTFSLNDGNGVLLSTYYWANTDINKINVSDNFVNQNGGTGIEINAERCSTLVDYTASIFNIHLLKNSILSNGGGVLLKASKRGYQHGNLNNATIQGSVITNSHGNGIELFGSGSNIVILNNTVSSTAGIAISGVRTNCSRNSISYNTFGILYSSSDNIAHENDIYQNTYGMNVTGGSVNAEYNYWGDSSGPYHVSLNPEGKGNPVNGDGTDLDFIPFSSSSFGPIIAIESLVVSVALNPLTIGSSGEVSVSAHVTKGTVAVDGVMVQLASDKGGSFSQSFGNTDSNGDFSSTFTAPSVTEQTSVKITATASKTGYTDGSDYEYVTVYPPGTLFLSVTVTVNPSQVQSSGTSAITVRVTDGTNAVSAATVALSSNNGGSLSPPSGKTDANGYFTSTFTAPTVNTQTTITITANATKTGYLNGQGQQQITVNHSPPPEEDSTLWIYLAILVIILVAIVGIFAIARRKRHKPETKEQEIQKSTSPPY